MFLQFLFMAESRVYSVTILDLEILFGQILGKTMSIQATKLSPNFDKPSIPWGEGHGKLGRFNKTGSIKFHLSLYWLSDIRREFGAGSKTYGLVGRVITSEFH